MNKYQRAVADTDVSENYMALVDGHLPALAPLAICPIRQK